MTFPLNKEVQDTILMMRQTMLNVEGFFSTNCLGIAANQINSRQRVVLMSRYPLNHKTKHKIIDVLINPEIIELSSTTSTLWEGCISDTE